MNIREYIDKRIKDIDFYLRGINYKNLNAENMVEKLPESLDTMFNKTPIYRKETENFVVTIRNFYDTLIAEELEFAESIQEVEICISKFETKLKLLIKEFKNKIFINYAKETGYQSNTINNSIEDLRIKIRDSKEERISPEKLHNLNELNGLREIFIYIYAFIEMIKDKTIKLENLLDLINVKYKVGTPEYKELIVKYVKLKSKNNYNEFIELYNKILAEINVPVDNLDNSVSEENKKSRT